MSIQPIGSRRYKTSHIGSDGADISSWIPTE